MYFDRVHEMLFAEEMTLRQACELIAEALVDVYRLRSVVLLLRINDVIAPYIQTGEFTRTHNLAQLGVQEAFDLFEASPRHRWLFTSAGEGGRAQSGLHISGDAADTFQIALGSEPRGVLLVSDYLTPELRRSLVQFCREVAMPLEILRLREELEQRTRIAQHLHSFMQMMSLAPPSESYNVILRSSTELVHAERGSLLLYNEAAEELAVKAVTGPRAEHVRAARLRLGESISGTVLREGHPLVIRDLASAIGYEPASRERSYKTDSFISFPIIVGERRVGVLNLTDKTDGTAYDELDLNLLKVFAPQIALALDRAEWYEKATEFEILSITDPLTNLLNRRYLEERLAEEIERSKRHRYPMSFMMLDIDDFKYYNDTNGHQAGDLALEMTAQNLKSALRTEDVAARYGGEEFSVLLPQTNMEEARVIAERIRRRVERTRYPHGAKQPLGFVTVSVGISTFTPHTDSPKSIIGAADHALYLAKRSGKNRVVTSDESFGGG